MLVVVVKQSFVIICAAGEAPDFRQVMYRSLERSPYDYRGAFLSTQNSGNFGCTSNGTGHFGFSDQNIRDQLWSDHFGRSDRNVPFRLTKLFSPVLFFCILLTRIITKRCRLGPVCATEMLGIISKAREISEISNRNFCWMESPPGWISFVQCPGARFSKVPITFRARNQIFKSKYKE